MKNAALKFLHRYLIYSSPFVLVVMLDGQLWPSVLPIGVMGDNALSTVTGIFFLLWLLSLLVFLFRIAFFATYREACFKTLAGLKERDEREEMIVGQAARSSFLLMLAILLVFFFLSTWRFGTSAIDNSGQSITLGHLDLVENVLSRSESGKTIYHSIPISKTALLALLVALQVVSFRYFSKKSSDQQ